jgi:hypothetical protein
MDIFLGVRELMVVAVMGGPPDRTFLRRGRADEGKNELEPTTRLVASV